jgi:hypothetical protein
MRPSAGLPLSVGKASLATRILIALVFFVTAILCIGGGMLISGTAIAARAIAIVLIVPLGLIGLLAAAFILVPHSRFGVWLDHFVPRLREPHIAVTTAAVLWLIAFVLT